MFKSQHLYCSISQVQEFLPHVTELGLGIEIVLDKHDLLWPQIRWEEILAIADLTSEAGIETTVHGSFYNLNLGARDEHILDYSLSLLLRGLEVSRAFRSPLMVFHTGFYPQLNPKSRKKWMEIFKPTLEKLITHAAELEVQLAMENTYEEDINLFEEIFDQFHVPSLGMCFDTGHAACFGKIEPSLWTTAFRDRICHVHCSDNDGKADLHWNIGDGIINFKSLLSPLTNYINPISMTYEVALNDAAASKEYIDNLLEPAEVRS